MEEDKEDAEELRIQQMTEPEQKGYKDWLAAAAQDIIENEVGFYILMNSYKKMQVFKITDKLDNESGCCSKSQKYSNF